MIKKIVFLVGFGIIVWGAFDLFKAYEACHERPLTPFEQVPDLVTK